MKKIMVYALLVWAAVSLASAKAASAEELTAALGNIIGEVEVKRTGTGEFIPAEDGMKVSAGDMVKTGAESYVTATFLPETYIEIASDSQLEILFHEIDGNTSLLNTKVELLYGHISKAVMRNLPPEALFVITLNEYHLPEVEAYHTAEEVEDISSFMPPEGVWEEEEGLPAVLSNEHGVVEIIRVGEVQSIIARNGMKLNVGDLLQTGKDSYVTLSILPDTYVDVAANSEVKIIRNRIEGPDGRRNTRLDVLSGHVSNSVARDLPENSLFEIVLVDYIPLEAEPYEPPAEIRPSLIPPPGSNF